MWKATETAELLCASMLMGFSKQVLPRSTMDACATSFINTDASAHLPGMYVGLFQIFLLPDLELALKSRSPQYPEHDET